MTENNNNYGHDQIPPEMKMHEKVIEHDVRLNFHDRRMDQMEDVIKTLTKGVNDLKKQIMIVGYGMVFVLGGTSDVGISLLTAIKAAIGG